MAGFVIADDQPVVFRSDVSLMRVDVQVLDRDNRAVTGLRASDFVLREEGRVQEIRNFASENMPVDVLLLLDVSGSMRPHVQRISNAAHAAFQVLAKDDRVAIMVFDQGTRIRLPFRNDKSEVERELDYVLQQERFNRGTDINGALLDAAAYVGREGRKEARRAVVILTDDQARHINDDAVDRELTRADAVVCLLLAPKAMMMNRGGRAPGGAWPGGGRRGPLGGIILGPQGRIPTSTNPVPGRGPGDISAGTADVVRDSGGDTFPVDDAYALESTLSRLRQRYALYFNLPPGLRSGDQRNIRVDLADGMDRRYPGAELRYRRTYFAPISTPGSPSDPVSVSQQPVWRPVEQAETPRSRPRGELSSGPRNGPLVVHQDDPGEASRESAASAPAPPPPPASNPPAQPSQDANQGGGWRQLKPGEKP